MSFKVTVRSPTGGTLTLSKSQALALARKIRAAIPALPMRSETYDDYLVRTLCEKLENAANGA